MNNRALTICAVALLSGCNKPAPESVEPSPVVTPVATPAKTPVVKIAPVVVAKTPTPIPIVGAKSVDTRFSSRPSTAKERSRQSFQSFRQDPSIPSSSPRSSFSGAVGLIVDEVRKVRTEDEALDLESEIRTLAFEQESFKQDLSERNSLGYLQKIRAQTYLIDALNALAKATNSKRLYMKDESSTSFIHLRNMNGHISWAKRSAEIADTF